MVPVRAGAGRSWDGLTCCRRYWGAQLFIVEKEPELIPDFAANEWLLSLASALLSCIVCVNLLCSLISCFV
jgi:hypothetical protein